MTSEYDPQASLHDIRRMQDRTLHEYVRYCFSRPIVVAVAVVLFIALAARDLPEPWGGGVSLAGVAALVATAVVHGRRATVRRRPSKAEVLLLAAATGALLAAFAVFTAAAIALDLPAPHTLAAAALALTSVVAAECSRRPYEALVRREDRRG